MIGPEPTLTCKKLDFTSNLGCKQVESKGGLACKQIHFSDWSQNMIIMHKF